MSAFGGKADYILRELKSPLIASSGHQGAVYLQPLCLRHISALCPSGMLAQGSGLE